MNRYVFWILATAFGVGLGAWALILQPSGPVVASSDSADPVAGQMLYQENCAVCHGANLQGQPNWRTPGADGLLPAPPHDKSGHTWHHGDRLLFTYTKLGGKQALAQQGIDFNSGMPGFADQLSDGQILDILAYIKSTWPDQQKAAQAARSEAESAVEEGN